MRAVSFRSCFKLHNKKIEKIIISYQGHGLGCGPAGNAKTHILSLHSDNMRNNKSACVKSGGLV